MFALILPVLMPLMSVRMWQRRKQQAHHRSLSCLLLLLAGAGAAELLLQLQLPLPMKLPLPPPQPRRHLCPTASMIAAPTNTLRPSQQQLLQLHKCGGMLLRDPQSSRICWPYCNDPETTSNLLGASLQTCQSSFLSCDLQCLGKCSISPMNNSDRKPSIHTRPHAYLTMIQELHRGELPQMHNFVCGDRLCTTTVPLK